MGAESRAGIQGKDGKGAEACSVIATSPLLKVVEHVSSIGTSKQGKNLNLNTTPSIFYIYTLLRDSRDIIYNE